MVAAAVTTSSTSPIYDNTYYGSPRHRYELKIIGANPLLLISTMMTRKATAKDTENKLKLALLELKKCKDENSLLLRERVDCEEEIKEVNHKVVSLKGELAELHIENMDLLDQRDRLQQEVNSFGSSALNVLTLKNEENLTELIYALKDIKWDIIGLSEVRRMGETIASYSDYILYHIGETPGQHGIYSPTEQSNLETINAFYLDLNKAIEEHSHKNLIVMGDCNGQIGDRRLGETKILGPFTYSNKTRSRNGEFITNFAQRNNLSILNTMFMRKKKNMWTWISPDGKTKNQIDFIMTNRSRHFTNFTEINKLNFNTNHKLIRAELVAKPMKKPRPKQDPTTLKFGKYQLEQITNSLRDQLTNFKSITQELGTQAKYDWLENTIKSKTQTQLTANTKFEPKKCLTTNTIRLLDARNHLISARGMQDRRKHLTKISKEIKDSIRKDRKQNRIKIIEKYINRTGGVKKAYKELSNSMNWIVKMKSRNGKWIHYRADILETAASYYKDLYKNDIKGKEIVLTETSHIPTILQAEVEKAIDTQKIDKTPGPDGISNEILKHSKEVLAPVLTDMFNDIVDTEIIPQQWTESNIILLYKKGDKHDIRNYRPISLMSNIYKTFAKIILKRIERTLDEHQPIEQAGFRKDYSVIDHIHAVRQVLEKYNEYQLTYYIAFIDYSKAFDSLLHDNIWKALMDQGIEHKYIRLIRNVYRHSTARIQLERKGDPFKVEKGVRQGDPLSPKLFSAVLESIFRQLSWENLGINVDGTSLTNLRFADDIVLFAKTPEDINKMIEDLAKESEKVGLKLNPEKTRVMTNGNKTTIRVKNTEIKYTDEYVYLGQLITQNESITKEIERRIANGWNRYWSLKEAMKDKQLHIKVKSKLFNTCVLPVLMYGCQSWALNQKMSSKLATCQYAMERSMLNVKKSDKLKNRVIRYKTKVIDITQKIRRLKWRWAGHLIRGHDKWSKKVTRWYPREGKRKRGRPQKRWDDEIREVAGVMWNRVAQERVE
ncbi:uncharacterized protein LOC142986144 [Anticarsia gemmatalis]|uniref:uncharacterized protein LOC142986144 n=1 Tax=Anticarsia gemmatalis TaxID=129554 RepID=UPI003F76F446